MQYVAIIEKGPTSYGAYLPDLPGCIAAGDTYEETETLIREAVVLHLELMREYGDPIPEPTRTTALVEA
ncbi:MAG: type II toxin-antitoxin system HicB family antitoxin [Chloroflexota bacterium]|nr:type II toxin-antitoxin system HicB family antitoxin [Chloroflexota bacterium]MDE2886427.1 type II toxin-antitoxin system HicB family antitoxin [Chloroflexota bacterium]